MLGLFSAQSLVVQCGVLHGLSHLLGSWCWDGGDGYLIGQPLPFPHLPQQVVFSLLIFSPLFLLRSLQHMVHPLFCSLWLGRGRGHVYDIIRRRGWGAVDARCSSRAKGAVLDRSARICGGVWRPSVGSGERWGCWFLTILIFLLLWQDHTHPMTTCTHQEYG